MLLMRRMHVQTPSLTVRLSLHHLGSSLTCMLCSEDDMVGQCVCVCVYVYITLLAVVEVKRGGWLAAVRYLGTPVWALATAPAQRYPKCGRRCARNSNETKGKQRQSSNHLSAFERTNKRVIERGTDEVKERGYRHVYVCMYEAGRSY